MTYKSVWRIRDVYPGSWFLPIPDPESKNSNKRQGWKIFLGQTIFCSQKFHKTEYYFQKGTGSRIRIRNTDINCLNHPLIEWLRICPTDQDSQWAQDTNNPNLDSCFSCSATGRTIFLVAGSRVTSRKVSVLPEAHLPTIRPFHSPSTWGQGHGGSPTGRECDWEKISYRASRGICAFLVDYENNCSFPSIANTSQTFY